MRSLFASREERYAAARALSHLLRDVGPTVLTVDRYGYASLEAVLFELQRLGFSISMDHLLEIVEKDAQKRFEIFTSSIRAKTGHRYPVEPASDPVVPPDFLYHGTSPRAAKRILTSGILRMGKAYVHLSSTVERARRVGLRKSDQPVILCVSARKACEACLRFWRSGQVSPDGEIFLSDEIPAEFITRVEV